MAPRRPPRRMQLHTGARARVRTHTHRRQLAHAQHRLRCRAPLSRSDSRLGSLAIDSPARLPKRGAPRVDERRPQYPSSREPHPGFESALRLQVTALPRYLVLHLKRFRPNYATGRYDKSTARVGVPLSLDLARHCAGANCSPPEYPDAAKVRERARAQWRGRARAQQYPRLRAREAAARNRKAPGGRPNESVLGRILWRSGWPVCRRWPSRGMTPSEPSFPPSSHSGSCTRRRQGR